MSIWKKLHHHAHTGIEPFLKEREDFCVSAISRFNGKIIENVWASYGQKADNESSVSALLLYGKQLLFPVFNFTPEKTAEYNNFGLPLPPLFPFLVRNKNIHAAQGMANDMGLLENALEGKGITPVSKYDYELLHFDYSEDLPVKTLPGLIIRRAEVSDTGRLFPLQAAYEKEEVLPKGAEFNPASCRRVLESLIEENVILTAELEGRLAGKININAESYNRFQIGGVYVLPEYRSQGIARAMTAALINSFAPQKKHFTLFVKIKNTPARRAYDSLGFKAIGEYRISYYT